VARNTTLSQLLSMLRAECKLSTSTSAGLDNRDYLVQVIKRHYDDLYQDYDWPFMRIVRGDAGKTLAAGQRYYDFPTTLNQDKPFIVWHQFGNIWYRLEQGVGAEEYSAQDSDADERSDPQQKWDFYGETQFEVWPLPATNGGVIRFEGTKLKNELDNDNDTADIDDLLIVLHAAAEVLADKDKKSASTKGNLAAKRLAKLRGNVASGKRVVFGAGSAEAHKTRTVRIARA
jgi:hypothetical protein